MLEDAAVKKEKAEEVETVNAQVEKEQVAKIAQEVGGSLGKP